MANIGYYGALQTPCTCNPGVRNMLTALKEAPWKPGVHMTRIQALLPTRCDTCYRDRWFPLLTDSVWDSHETVEVYIPTSVYAQARRAIGKSRVSGVAGATGKDESSTVTLYNSIELRGLISGGTDYTSLSLLESAVDELLPFFAMQVRHVGGLVLPNGTTLEGSTVTGGYLSTAKYLLTLGFAGQLGSQRVYAHEMTQVLPKAPVVSAQRNLHDLVMVADGILRNLELTRICCADESTSVFDIFSSESQDESEWTHDLDYFLFGIRPGSNQVLVHRPLPPPARPEPATMEAAGFLLPTSLRPVDPLRVLGEGLAAANDAPQRPAPERRRQDNVPYAAVDFYSPAHYKSAMEDAVIAELGAVPRDDDIVTTRLNTKYTWSDFVKLDPIEARELFPIGFAPITPKLVQHSTRFTDCKQALGHAPVIKKIRRTMNAHDATLINCAHMLQQFKSEWKVGKPYDLQDIPTSTGKAGQSPNSALHKVQTHYTPTQPGAIVHRTEHGLLCEVIRSDGMTAICTMEGTEPVAIKIAPCFLHSLAHHCAYPTLVNAVITRYLNANRDCKLESSEKSRINNLIKYLTTGTNVTIDEKGSREQLYCKGPFHNDNLKAAADKLFKSMPEDPAFWVDLTAGKLSPDRLMNGVKYLQDILQSRGAREVCKALLKKYKLQTKPEGASAKEKPRIICNVDDINQFVSICLIKLFETCYFTHGGTKDWCYQNEMHIKNRGRASALLGFCKKTHRKCDPMSGLMIEGDGSNWDCNISRDLMKLIELPILEHITKFLYGYFASMGSTWLSELIKAGMVNRNMEEVKFLLSSKDKTEKLLAQLINAKYQAVPLISLAIWRLSGDRGTSSLNHLVNAVLWACALFERPELFFIKFPVDPRSSCYHKARCSGIEVSGGRVWLRSHAKYDLSSTQWEDLKNELGADGIRFEQTHKGRRVWLDVTALFEGDDSGLYTYLRTAVDKHWEGGHPTALVPGIAVAKWVEAIAAPFFTRAGMDMVFNLATNGKVCELIGANLINGFLDEGWCGLAMAYVPMLLRNLNAAPWSVSQQAIRAGMGHKAYSDVAYSSLMARACSFPAGRVTSLVANYFRRCALWHSRAGMDSELKRDDAHRLGLEVGTTINLADHYEHMQTTHHSEGGLAGMDERALAEIVRQTAGSFSTRDIINLGGDVPISPHDAVGRMFPPSWHRKYLEGTVLPMQQVLGTLVIGS